MAAGQGSLGSVFTDEGRRSARLLEKEELKKGTDAITDDTLAEALADAILGAEEITGKVSGGKRRGGGKTTEAIKNVVKSILGGAGSVIGVVDSAIGTAINTTAGAVKIVGAVGSAAVVLNHPTMIGNLAKLSAAVLTTGADQAVQSTWGDWGSAILSIKESLGTVLRGIVSQTQQGPVVPVAVAVAILTWYANKTGKSVTDVLKSTSATIASKTARVVTGQVQAAVTAYEEGALHKSLGQLKELAKRSKVRTPGEGAPATTMTSLSSGVSSVQSGPAPGMIRVVPGTATAQKGDFKAALAPIVNLPESNQPLPEEVKDDVFADGLELLAAIAASESPVVTGPPSPAPPGYPTGSEGEGKRGERYSREREERFAAMDKEREKEKRGLDRGNPTPSSSSAAGVLAPPPSPASSVIPKPKSDGGRRNKTRGKKMKRRVTRRKARVQVVKFAY